MISTVIEIPEHVYMALQKLMDGRKDLDLNKCFEAAMAAYIEESKGAIEC